jgi:regulator of sigma E protease
MQFLKVIFIILEVILLFNLLIIVHELGHFLAARWRGLKIEKFGIWFGKPLWQKKVNGVTYALGSIPAGGFVSLPQMAPMDVIEGKTESEQAALPPISPLDKIIVAFAGPLFSFGLAVVFAAIVWWIGRPVSEAEKTTMVGHVEAGSPAEKAGLQAGDRILTVDGYPVSRFAGIGDSVTWRVVSSTGDKIPIEVERDGKTLRLESEYVKEETKFWERESLRQIRIHPRKTALVARVMPNSPAARAGMRPSDVVIEAGGKPLLAPEALGDLVERMGPGRPIDLKIKRDSRVVEVRVAPETPLYPPEVPSDERRAMIGIEWERTGKWTVDHPDPWRQISDSVKSMVNTFEALFTPKSDVKAQHLSGFVGIMRIYYVLFEDANGWRQAIWFSVILNVNLALLNLLPIPVLDGGHILLALLEGLRRRPIRARTLAALQTACAVLIIGYMAYVTFFDVQDLPWKRPQQIEIRFPDPSPPAAPSGVTP